MTKVQNSLIDTPYHCAYQSAEFLTKKWRGLLYSCSVFLSFLPKYVHSSFHGNNTQEISLRSSTEVQGSMDLIVEFHGELRTDMFALGGLFMK